MAKQSKKELINLIASEMSLLAINNIQPSDIPVRDQSQFDALIGADEDPLQVVVKIPVGYGNQGAGYYYGPNILVSMEEQINSKLIPGYEGHTPTEQRSYVKREIVTYWVGAVYKHEHQALYVRGLVARKFDQLKLEIRSGVVTQVSLYGPAQLDYDLDREEWVTVSLKLESLDWTAVGLAGMDTSLISTEMTKEGGHDQMTLQEWLAKGKELGFTFDAIVGEMAQGKVVLSVEDKQKLESATTDIAAEMARVTGKEVADGQAILTVVGEMVSELKDVKGQLHTFIAKEMVAEKVEVKEVQDFVLNTLNDKLVGKNKEEMASEIAKFIDLPAVKTMVKAHFVNTNLADHQEDKNTNDLGIKFVDKN